MFSGRKGLFGAFFLAVSLAVPVLPASASDTVQITRGEIAAELWELAGSPVGPFADSGFADVATATVNKTAIDWLAATGITIGRADGTYGVDAFLIRGEKATMLYRLAGSPEGPFAPAPFGDVHPNGTHTTSINWLATTGITVGQSHGRFGPFVPVTRTQARLFVERFAAAPNVAVTVPDVAIRTAPPAAPLAAFPLAANGVTVICPDAAVGDKGLVGTVEFTKRTEDQITVENASTTCTSGITNMYLLFGGQATFNGDISHWDTSSVTDMANMFNGASVFDGDISHWDTSSVTDMANMFNSARVFDGDISDWDTSSVTDMSKMFFFTVFDGDISDWDTSKVQSMVDMFNSASNFDGDISGWDTSRVVSMNGMFSGAGAFNADISGWDTSQVTDMRNMFTAAAAFNRDLSGWCVEKVEVTGNNPPSNFNASANSVWRMDPAKQPHWGTATGCAPAVTL